MKHGNIVNVLKILRRELIRKQNARSNNNNSLWSFLFKLPHRVSNTYKCFTCTSHSTNDTFAMILSCSHTLLLMRSKRKHEVQINEVIISGIWSCGKVVCQFENCQSINHNIRCCCKFSKF